MQGYQWAFLKSRIKGALSPAGREREREYGDAAAEEVARGRTIGSEVVGRQRAALDAAWGAMGFRFNERMVYGIEVQFLWGLYSEMVADGPPLPTNGYDRVMLHMIGYLVAERRIPLSQARGEVSAVQDFYNEDNQLFGAIEKRGRQAYRDGSDQHFVDIVWALHKSGTKPRRIRTAAPVLGEGVS
ncbi:MAG TPA: hypothetical protein VFR21_13955 [Bradyrhizobium sp.]|jgi:hypothetical protein|nr:hypothetical protein [Bradyrhizobium sp.]